MTRRSLSLTHGRTGWFTLLNSDGDASDLPNAVDQTSAPTARPLERQQLELFLPPVNSSASSSMVLGMTAGSDEAKLGHGQEVRWLLGA